MTSKGKKFKGFIAIDLDGVLAQYDGWKGKDHIGEPTPGMKELIQDWIDEGWKIIVFTSRGSHETDLWCTKYQIPYHYINVNPEFLGQNPGKPIANVYIDDRAIRFTGDIDRLRDQVKALGDDGFFSDWGKTLREKAILTTDNFVERWERDEIVQEEGDPDDPLDKAIEIIYEYVKYGISIFSTDLPDEVQTYLASLHLKASEFWEDHCRKRDKTYPVENRIFKENGSPIEGKTRIRINKSEATAFTVFCGENKIWSSPLISYRVPGLYLDVYIERKDLDKIRTKFTAEVVI